MGNLEKQQDQTSWAEYYEKTMGADAHHTLQSALRLFEAAGVMTGFALDLGCGDGRDTMELLFRGWSVLAIDKDAAAIDRLEEQAGAMGHRLETKVADFQKETFPDAMLVNASLSLAYCEKEQFDATWEKVRKAVQKGGRFAGHFFGGKDDWAAAGKLVYHEREEIVQLLSGFEMEAFSEMECDVPGADGSGSKHWHIFHVVAQKQ